jgi:hypothetical protein
MLLKPLIVNEIGKSKQPKTMAIHEGWTKQKMPVLSGSESL